MRKSAIAEIRNQATFVTTEGHASWNAPLMMKAMAPRRFAVWKALPVFSQPMETARKALRIAAAPAQPAMRSVEDVYTVAPQIRGRVLGVHAQTWQHCFALLSPERAEAVLELQRSIGSLHFVGDYTSETAGTHGAYTEAERVAALIRDSLRHTV
jgi:hypothetical protein